MSRWTPLLCAFGMAIATVACSETDAGVTTKVKAKLAADDTVKAYQIDVDTANKVVTLKGTVENPAAKTIAVQLARDTEGVASVVDNIVVANRTAGTTDTPGSPNVSDATDPSITAAVKSRLLADPDVAGLKIDVDTQSGVVTLSGTVKTAAEKAEAVSIARDTTGVRSVNDKLTVGR
jgi:hyperosmotically inducible protein